MDKDTSSTERPSGIHAVELRDDTLYFAVNSPDERFFEVFIEWDNEKQRYEVYANDHLIGLL